jgi:UDP-glucose-4-epimerase GalE
MNILVTGGAGFIGSHVCKRLQQAGFNPITYDNLSTGHTWAIQFGPFVRGDLENEEALSRVFDQYRPGAVIHLASLINVRDSIINPTLYYEKNFLASLTLLKTMLRKNVNKLVFSSTAAIYGAPKYLPIDEEHPKNPLNAYGKSKWAVEGLLEDFAHAHGLLFAALRYFNACGADASNEIGEAHLPETHLIPLVIQAALKQNMVDEYEKENKTFLRIYGDDYPTPDGTAIRDYIHVSDLAEAHLKALQYLFAKKRSLQANLGTGRGYSVKEIIDTVAHFSQTNIPTITVPRLPQDSAVLVANASLAKEVLGWEPVHSHLSHIVETAWNWHSKVEAVL